MNWFLGDLIDRNISKKVLQSICIVAIALSTLDFLFSLISEISDLSISYQISDAFLYSLISIPSSLYAYLSYICLLGVLIGLGSIKEEGELIGAKVLGKSDFSLVIACLRPTLLIIILSFIFQEISLPSISQANEENRLIKQNKITLDEGYWIAAESSITFFKSSPNRSLIKDITIYQLDDKNKINQVISSPSAIEEEGIWTLINSTVNNFRISDPKIYERKIWEDAPKDSDMRRILSPKYFSITELRNAINEEVSEYRKNNLLLEYWRKIFHPIITIILVFLASSFVFGQVRDNNLGQRLLAGIVFAFSLNMFQSLFESMAVVSFLKPLTAVLFPMLIVLLLTLFVWKIKSN